MERIRKLQSKCHQRFEFTGGLIMEDKKTNVTKTVKAGVSFGSALAMVISYVNWHSIGWAIFHGILGWVYVIYYAIKY